MKTAENRLENRELKRLRRAELLDIIYAMKEKEEELQRKLDAAQEALEKQEMAIRRAGSIAQASLELHDVFGAAQRAADTYVRTVKARYASLDDTMRQVVDARMAEAAGKPAEAAGGLAEDGEAPNAETMSPTGDNG